MPNTDVILCCSNFSAMKGRYLLAILCAVAVSAWVGSVQASDDDEEDDEDTTISVGRPPQPNASQSTPNPSTQQQPRPVAGRPATSSPGIPASQPPDEHQSSDQQFKEAARDAALEVIDAVATSIAQSIIQGGGIPSSASGENAPSRSDEPYEAQGYRRPKENRW